MPLSEPSRHALYEGLAKIIEDEEVVADVVSQLPSAETATKLDIADVRTEIAEVRTEIAGVRTEMAAMEVRLIHTIHREVRTAIFALGGIMASLFAVAVAAR